MVFGSSQKECEKMGNVLIQLWQRVCLTMMMLVVILAFGSCARHDVSVHSDRRPTFDLFDFFDGKSVAYGIFEDRFGNLRRQFRVEITGKKQDGRLILDEKFIYDDGEQDQRVWVIERSTDMSDSMAVSYVGRAEDISGSAAGTVSGNAMSWRYDIDLNLSGRQMRVSFDDYIYQMDEDIAVNRAYVSKWGVEIGSVTLVFLKGRLADPLLPVNLQSWQGGAGKHAHLALF